MRRLLFSFIVFFSSCLMLFAQGFKNTAATFGIDKSYTTVEYGGGVSFVDFNQDGKDDLSYATESGMPVLFFLNTGNGFKEIPSLIIDTSEVKQVLWVDYNNDGLLDLYLTSESKNKLFKNTGNLQLIEVTELVGLESPILTSYCSTWLDYNRDGKLDLVVAHRTAEQSGQVDLYRNIDFESFEKATLSAGLAGKGNSVLAMTSMDYNNDGWSDLFLAQDWEQGNQLLKNNGNGTFSDVSVACGADFKMNSMTATIMDINNDGWEDIYVSNTTAGNILLVNNTDGTFSEQAKKYQLNIRSVTFGTVFFDADNDGDEDVHIGGMQTNYTFEKTANQVFLRRNNDWGMSSDREFNNGVAIGDSNGDGFPDFAKNSVTRTDIFNSKNSLWENDFQENNFIKVKLKGLISNRYGIGARVYCYTNGQQQMKRIACGESFSSQHTLVQHFGLGQANQADSIVVQWPAGNRTVVKDIASNQTLLVEEPLAGCTKLNACNYHPDAQIDNGTCRLPSVYYDCNGCLNDVDEDGICDELEILGCTAAAACNFSTAVTEDDGSCYYLTAHEIMGITTAQALQEVTYHYPAATTSHCEWSITNGAIVLGNGTTTVTVLWYNKAAGQLSVQETNTSGCAGTRIALEIAITPQSISQETVLTIYPNPAQHQLYLTGVGDTPIPYRIHDAMGRRVLDGTSTLENTAIEVFTLPAGWYLFVAEEKEKRTYQTFFKE